MTVIWIAVGLWAYAYFGYPAILRLLAAAKPVRAAPPRPEPWPLISIVVPAYNEERAIAETLEAILKTDYPADRRQILVISDASMDQTDQIVSNFASRGVELLRMRVRGGKTAAENQARSVLRGEIIINTDSSVRVDAGALKPLVAAFADPRVGVASSRDVSVARVDAAANPGEGAYVGYEMWVRGLETRVDGIVGASGSLYAIRAALHQHELPAALSRDFAAALVARKAGFRSVSVPTAICYVPRGVSLRQEYHRKVRTMTRGLGTLFYMKALLNPFREGVFAWMLASHKLARWLLPWATVALLLAAAIVAPRSYGALLVTLAGALVAVLAVAGWFWPSGRSVPRVVALSAFAAAGVVAGVHAWIRLWTGKLAPTWEPTRRGH
jgi:cellulose synthase/poly-beta-1,6-N-acetylglucosamine synthase-like glycosyltransferase